MNLGDETDRVLRNLEIYERNWHIFKIVLILAGFISLGLLIFFETNKTVDRINAKNTRVEHLLRCSLPAFTPDEYPKANSIIKHCLNVNK